MATQIFEVGIGADQLTDNGTFKIIYTPATLTPYIHLKNEKDASELYELLQKLHERRNIFPKKVAITGTTATGQSATIEIPLSAFLKETFFYIQNEFDKTVEKKKWIKSQLNTDDLADLGLTP